MTVFTIPENGHFVNALPVCNLNGGETSDVWSMENYAGCDIIVMIGATAGATVGIQVEECDDFTPTTSPGITHWGYYYESTSTGDTPAARATTSSTIGITLSASANSFCIIHIDNKHMSDGYENLRVTVRNPGAAVNGAIGVVLTGARYAQSQTPTAIA